jgi:hypothetical protein
MSDKCDVGKYTFTGMIRICLYCLRYNNIRSSNEQYTDSISYYKLGNFCVCVCLCVCVCVCLFVRLYVSTVLNGSSPNEEGSFYGSWHVPWAIYFVCARNVRACACSVHVLTACACFLEPIIASGSFIVTVYWTVMSIQTVERILSKCAGNVLLLTISVKDYVLFMFTHRACGCVRAGTAHMCAFAYFWTDYVHICWEHTTSHHKWQGLYTFHCHAPRVRVQARICERVRDYAFTYLWTDSLQICSEHTTNHNK